MEKKERNEAWLETVWWHEAEVALQCLTFALLLVMTVKLLWWSHVLWTELHWFIHQNKWAAETGGAALRRCWRQTQAGAKINFHFYFQRGSWRGPGDKAVTRTRHSPCKKEKHRDGGSTAAEVITGDIQVLLRKQISDLCGAQSLEN